LCFFGVIGIISGSLWRDGDMKAKQTRSKSRPAPVAKTKRPERGNELKKERDLLKKEVKELRAERDQYLKALYALTHEPLDIDKKAILSQLGREPSLRKLIEELELPGS
jgi:uncharacterized coiled-coil DUF342 family protein